MGQNESTGQSTRMLDWARRLTSADVGKRELRWLLIAVLVGFGLRVAFVLVTRGYALAGDQIEYNAIGNAAADGQWFHTTFPYDELRESAARPPGYPLFIGLIYSFIRATQTAVVMIQTLIGPIVIVLVWLLARRLLGAREAIVAAGFAALYPNMWQWEGRLYSEALALPLGALLLFLVLDREPTVRLAVAAGVVLGVSMLVRPTSVFFGLLIVAAFVTAVGWRRGIRQSVVVAGVAVLCIAPWSIRNYVVTDSFIPLSIQDIAVAGTFNPDSANDGEFPFAWRPYTERDSDIFGPQAPVRLSDAELREEMHSRAWDYVSEHPDSVPRAFFWNGIVRTWDLRPPDKILHEVPFEGRNRPVAQAGMVTYWFLLPCAIAGAWLLRSRRGLVVPIAVGTVAASVVFTVAAATRYRVPFEPAILLLASAALVAAWDRLRPQTQASRPSQ